MAESATSATSERTAERDRAWGMPKGGFRNEAGESVTLEAFTALVESLQRAGLRRGIEAVARNDLPDWHALVLDLPTESAE